MRSRRATRAGSAWLFGLATTIFLIAVWGRALVVDTEAIGQAAGPMAQSSVVVGLFNDWLDDELADAGVDETTSDVVVEDVLGRSSVEAALQEFVSEVIFAAASPSSREAAVDVGALLQPATPEISSVLDAAGVPVTERDVGEVVSDLDPLVVREAGSAPHIGSESPAAARLGTAAVLALLVMVLTGWSAVTAAEDRLAELRGLLNRVALGGLSFAIILKIGSWIVDPDGGRAPLAESISLLADAKWMVPLMLAIVAGGAGALVRVLRGSVKPEGVSPTGGEPPTSPEERRLTRSR